MSEAIGMVLQEDGMKSVMALPAGFTAGAASLDVANSVSWESFDLVGKLISAMTNWSAESLPWIVGDLMRAGARLFPERYHQAIEVTGWTYETIKNYEWAAAAVPKDNRIIGGKPIPIRAGMNVAPLPIEEQKRVLKQADKEGLTWKECHRLAMGDPNYKRKAVPERGWSAKDRVMRAFERVFEHNEERIMNSTPREAHLMMWTLCCEMWRELGYEHKTQTGRMEWKALDTE